MNGRTSVLRSFFSSRIMVLLGKRSYSIYLWQSFMAWALTGTFARTPLWIPVNVVATLTAAEISYRFVERPFMGRRRAGKVTSARVAVTR